jgi:hypothetical protein
MIQCRSEILFALQFVDKLSADRSFIDQVFSAHGAGGVAVNGQAGLIRIRNRQTDLIRVRNRQHQHGARQLWGDAGREAAPAGVGLAPA